MITMPRVLPGVVRRPEDRRLVVMMPATETRLFEGWGPSL
jgi:hypothetical protein